MAEAQPSLGLERDYQKTHNSGDKSDAAPSFPPPVTGFRDVATRPASWAATDPGARAAGMALHGPSGGVRRAKGVKLAF